MSIESGATVTVDQSNASAEGDIAGRDINKITNYYGNASRAAGVVEALLQRLDAELKNDQQAQNIIDRLQRYYTNRPRDGIIGLEAKLKHAGRGATYDDAIELKEMFVKLLHQWSLYASAQQIFVYLLARAERQFNDIILPQISSLGAAQVNTLVSELIVEPTVHDCGASVFEIDHNTALGMVYLRAQQSNNLTRAYTLISNEIKILLDHDLKRQDVFESPSSVNFTFEGDRMTVDDEHYFSASSRAILRSSFFLGFLAAATKNPFFRHPRFCMIDSQENMGVEAIRSQNFQLQMLRVSKESKVEHQIIFATAMIEPELEDEAYTVGAFSTNADRTVAIKMD